MAEYLSPGVYVEEYDSGATPMQGVSTSTAGFVGLAERGPVIGQPQLVTSFADYRRMYGGYLSQAGYGANRYLPYAVEQFFANGGSRAYIMRAVPNDAKTGSCTAGVLKLTAANPGVWADNMRVTVAPSSKAKTQVYDVNGADLTLKNADGFNTGDVVELFDGSRKAWATIKSVLDRVVTLDSPCSLAVADRTVGTAKYIKTCEITITARLDETVETYENLSLKPEALNYAPVRTEKSELIRVEVLAGPAAVSTGDSGGGDPDGGYENEGEPSSYSLESASAAPAGITPYELCGGTGGEMVLTLGGGSNGNVLGVTADAFLGKDDGPGRRTGLQAFLENGNVSIMAIPGITTPEVAAALIGFCEGRKSCFAILDVPMDLKKTNDVVNYRDMYDSTYAAMYHPWLQMFDAGAKRPDYFPPSGAMAGIYARSDNERGVHKAPANEVVRGCTGLSCLYNTGEQDILNPMGVNLIRSFPGRGIRVWGARTISSNGLWKYLNVRRLFIYVEESIRANTNWVVFEPNSETLWSRVTRTIETFLATCWRDGALAGTSPEQAFFVECGPTTMTQDDIDNGRLICQIGIAPVKPAEFVIFRITQKTATGE